MKYLLLFLLPLLCFGQGYKDITAYRFKLKYDDGPCSIASYLNSEIGKDAVAKVITKNSPLLRSLSRFKSNVRKGKSIEFNCYTGCVCNDEIDAIIILQNKIPDTLFLSESRGLLVFPKEKIAYQYDSKLFMDLLDENLKSFFEHDYISETKKKLLEE